MPWGLSLQPKSGVPSRSKKVIYGHHQKSLWSGKREARRDRWVPFLEDKEIRFDIRWLNLPPELQPSSEKILVPDLVPVRG